METPKNPFAIHIAPGQLDPSYRFRDGVQNSGVTSGELIFNVPEDAPNQLYYQSEVHFAMFGLIIIEGGTSAAQPSSAPTPPAPEVIEGIWTPKCAPFLTDDTPEEEKHTYPEFTTIFFSTFGIATTFQPEGQKKRAQTDAPTRIDHDDPAFAPEEVEEVEEEEEEDEFADHSRKAVQPEPEPRKNRLKKVKHNKRANAPANPEVIGGNIVTGGAAQTPAAVAPLDPASPSTGRGASYRCATSTRAEQLMDLALFNLAREGRVPSEDCSGTGGPGIFAPVHSARWFMANAVAMYNAWSVYDRHAKPMASRFPPAKRIAAFERTDANKEIAMTYAVYTVQKYILPNRENDIATSLLNAYGLDMRNPSNAAALNGVAAAKDFIASHLAIDGSNQQNCYADTSGYTPIDDPVVLDSYESVNNSYHSRKDFYTWADVKWTGHVPNRPFLTPDATHWRRLVIAEADRVKELDDLVQGALPTHEQLEKEMLFVTNVQSEIDIDNDGGTMSFLFFFSCFKKKICFRSKEAYSSLLG